MDFTRSDWYLVPLVLVIIALVGANELGFGVIAFLPLMLLAVWLMEKAFGSGDGGE